MTTWAHSPVYGRSVILGPTQTVVYRFVMDATTDGRRPYFALGTIAAATGRPVSSVHAALGRLRALGLIGAAARMGRNGGYRLWRTARKAGAILDNQRQRIAIARIIRRWYVRAVPSASAGGSDPLWPDVPPASVSRGGDAPYGTPGGERGAAGKGTPEPDNRPESPFRDAMRRAGFRPWWTDRRELAHDGPSDSTG